MGRFDGKVVLITGGARGQGRSHAVRFATEGADVAFCDVAAPLASVPYGLATPDDVAETVRQVEALGRRCLGVVADVRDQAATAAFVEQARAELGRVDFLLANAGVLSYAPVAEMDGRKWDEMIATNLTGVFHAMRAVLPLMIEQGHGRVVATSSVAGKQGIPNLGHYCAAKWGVIGLVKTAAMEVGEHGITVNAVCPTTVATDMAHNPATYRLFRPDLPEPTLADAEAAFAEPHVLPVPWIEPADVSATVAFLCSDEARFITGETISVAAGMTAGNAG
ncbi:mycofactocin-coupled SDR family oxidoreductase [Pseudonocardia sp. CA-107938]|uniref:mycofactocin-coupled SDR family oxidoreductase n=1 Tax=Pseudonocardia sp. CA-107938 TaxID=3240021 RepID=UPI003D933551